MVDVALAEKPDPITVEAVRRWLLLGVGVAGLEDAPDLSVADRLALVSDRLSGEPVAAEEGPRVADADDEA